MKHKHLLNATLLSGGLTWAMGVQAETPSATMLAYTCAGCHGTNGASHGPATPTIAGNSIDYFVDAMEAYKSGERPATIMGRIAKGYSTEEFERMAAFFAKQPFVPAQQKADRKLAAKGKKIHRKSCEKCHEDGGSSSEDDAGILAGQWTPYLQYSIEDFLDGSRPMPKKMKKRLLKVHKKEGDRGIEALLNYYASKK